MYRQKSYVLAIGTFDGVHLGHRKIIEVLKNKASKYNSKSMLVAFNNSPRELIMSSSIERLTTKAEKKTLLDEFKIDKLVQCDFTNDIRIMTQKEFLDSFNVDIRALVVGHDFRFGNDKKAPSDLNLEIFKVDPVSVDGMIVGSSLIRDLIKKPDLILANRMLNSIYIIEGEVIGGEKRGRKLGLRTANIDYPETKLIPPEGVYITRTIVDDKSYTSVTNIGNAPTFNRQTSNIESHLIGFDADIYNRVIKIQFYKRIRPIINFEDKNQLIRQIEVDIKETYNFFERRKKYDKNARGTKENNRT